VFEFLAGALRGVLAHGAWAAPADVAGRSPASAVAEAAAKAGSLRPSIIGPRGGGASSFSVGCARTSTRQRTLVTCSRSPDSIS
jgi:hypothetical protein